MPYGAMAAHSVRIFLTAAVLFASASAAANPGAVRSLLEIRQEKVVVQQWDMSCGAAALATVLTYQLGDPISEKRIAYDMLRRTNPLRVKYRGGFSLLDMKRYAETRGFAANGYARLTLQNLHKLAPLIVPVKLDGYDHFVVYRGMAAGHAVLADPAFGNRTLPLAEFEKAWNGNIGFVIRRPDPSRLVNRLSPRKEDLLAVGDATIRAAMDADIPKPLEDWQMVDLPWNRENVESAMAARDRSGPDAPMSSREADAIVAGATDPISPPNLTNGMADLMPMPPTLTLNASPAASVSLTTTGVTPLQTSGTSPSTSLSVTSTGLTLSSTSTTSPSASVSLTTTGLTTASTTGTSPSVSASVTASGLTASPTSGTSPSASTTVTTTVPTQSQLSTSPTTSTSVTATTAPTRLEPTRSLSAPLSTTQSIPVLTDTLRR